jgi:tRNA(Ile)-lysidine synthase
MIHLFKKPPRKLFYLACSGGIDSMVAMDFLLKGGHNFKLININHGTDYGEKASFFLKEISKKYNIELLLFKPKRAIHTNESPEEYWRNLRYEIFHSCKLPIVTAHHLDDVVEWWILSSLCGKPKLTPYKNKNVIRPFLLTSKQQIINWSLKNSIEYIEDPSNKSNKYMRNIVRNKIMPYAIKINPGIRKVIRKKLLDVKYSDL